jgi:hypothetical protein
MMIPQATNRPPNFQTNFRQTIDAYSHGQTSTDIQTIDGTTIDEDSNIQTIHGTANHTHSNVETNDIQANDTNSHRQANYFQTKFQAIEANE